MADFYTLIGQTVSHYRILEKLGGGGMDVVSTGWIGRRPGVPGNNYWQLALKNSGKVVLPTCDIRFMPFPTDEERRAGVLSSPPFLFYHFEKVPVMGRRYSRYTAYIIKGDRIYSGVIETPTRSFVEVIKFEPDPNDRTRYIPKCIVATLSGKMLEKDCSPQ